ncbi:purine-binding chemotaxis protein CheW [Ktedonosporobacter rubrisoli]|uniref:Purine-binding chemotaxis protein CheW n=1 Tax=Ktedonosporobacter rubrisoli TaxID=2509675 RepID=A0A4P6K2F4_KTERU|nr:chemotaxis protein CheW [Ktedonosporobacter rubrisoli]QBD82388.1 purine-binding chemotaxis protein CheW [Ktedonosporobacter rubrisoli]
MSSEDLRMLQRDALAAIQQLGTQSPSVAALQMQLAQRGLPRADGSVNENQPAVVGEQYLVFSLAGCELAVKAEQVQAVERLVDLTPVPNVVSWVKGVINLRGSIVSVVDLRMFLDLEQLSYTSRARLLSLQYNEMVICLVVDSVSEMMPISPATIVPVNARQANIPQWALSYAAGCALHANRVLVLLDAARLLFSEKMQRYEALG